MAEQNWPVAWTRAALEMCVLAVIQDAGVTHGYDIVRRLQSGGLGEIKGGTLYPVLARLEEQGFTRTRWAEGVGGPGRKLVEITDRGRSERTDRLNDWTVWTSRVQTLLGTGSHPLPAQQKTGVQR